ncbi:MAG: hypothetical protein E6356_13880 [Terrisporobacter othiniensis]|nr:hypothetical protein [Terrisporobacter othiniensis]
MKLKENVVVNCKNKDDARVFLNECKKQGFNDSYYDEYTNWEEFKEDTCYKIYNKNGIRYASKSFYISEGCKITNFDDLFKNESKFKVGDKVRVINKGKQYSTYRDFIKNKLPKRLKDFKYGDIVPCDEEYKVVFVEKREDDNEYICVIEDLNTKQIFMIEDKGIDIINENKNMGCGNMKFKVGDKVRVKSGLKVGITYGNIEFLNIMDKYSGLKCTIENITNEGNYVLKNSKYSLNYSEEMLEKVKEEKKMSKCKVYEMPEYVGSNVKKVIINEPCIIVILNSGEKGVAKCCPEDKFIEERGYKLALERAMKEKYLNDVVRQDTIINQWLKIFENEDKYKDLIF